MKHGERSSTLRRKEVNTTLIKGKSALLRSWNSLLNEFGADGNGEILTSSEVGAVRHFPFREKYYGKRGRICYVSDVDSVGYIEFNGERRVFISESALVPERSNL